VARQWYATHGFHPTFFYEAIWNLVGFGLLWFGGRRFSTWLRDGDVFFLYLIWYPVGRFWVEMFRPDAWRLGTLATAQWFALAGIALGAVGLIVNHRRRKNLPKAVCSGEVRR
jgi:phosphatidylglycerol:prolipoprotein diacylglycerol transferase